MTRRQPTGLTFEIRTVEDFLAIPHTRRAACLREFASFLKLASAFNGLLEAVTDEVTGVPGAVKYKVEVFRWTDDGRKDISVNVFPPSDPGAPSSGAEA